MENRKKNKVDNFKVELGLAEGKEWSAGKIAGIKEYVKSHAAKRSPERKLKNEILALKYQMEVYVDNKEINEKTIVSLETFLNLYLKTLNITFKKFATSIDTTDGNLKKYLSGDRKFNIDLAFRFSHFFHTTPDLWLNVYSKNELISVKAERRKMSRYKKYDYEKILG